MARNEQMQELPDASRIVIDEMDETILEYPYTFLPGSTTLFNIIWNL